MLEAIIGGLVGAVVGAFAGGYATYRAERKLETTRKAEAAVDWMHSELELLEEEMRSIATYGPRAIEEKNYDLTTGYIRERAKGIRERIHELEDQETRRRLYRMFEQYYETYEEMLDAVELEHRRLLKRARPDMVAVKQEVTRECRKKEMNISDIDELWAMPPNLKWAQGIWGMFGRKAMMFDMGLEWHTSDDDTHGNESGEIPPDTEENREKL